MLHLIHPFLVHFIVAWFLLAAGLELVEKFFKKTFSFLPILYLLTSIISLLVIASGCLASELIFTPVHAESALDVHETLGVLTAALIFVVSLWRGAASSERIIQFRKYLWIVVSILALALLYTAYTGGELVYKHAVGVTFPSGEKKNSIQKPDSLKRQKIEFFEAK